MLHCRDLFHLSDLMTRAVDRLLIAGSHCFIFGGLSAKKCLLQDQLSINYNMSTAEGFSGVSSTRNCISNF